MTITVSTTPWNSIEADWLIVGICQNDDWGSELQGLDDALGGTLTRLRETGDLNGKAGSKLAIHDAQGIVAKRILLIGLGKPDKLDGARVHKSMMSAVRQISEKQETSVAVGIPADAAGSLLAGVLAQIVATAAVTGPVGQDLYRKEPGRYPLSAVTILTTTDAESEVTSAVSQGAILGEAVNLTRELVNRPAADIYPESFAARAAAMADSCGLKCEVLDEAKLSEEKMGSLLAVAQGSDRPARVVVLEHAGGDANGPTLALVGKGVTFDSGGLSLKTSEGMKTMKCDMAGAATVLGAMSAIARLKLPVNVIGVMGLVENMVSGNSYKLGDVLTARNGTTIEVLNTDAEGRLVLADVLAYAVDRGADKLIDLATLTGACVVALGVEVTGTFTNDESWQSDVLAAAGRSGEHAWPMPMFDHFGELLKSDVADCKNVGPRWGGAITAAKFLEKFVSEKPWVHLDIAGPSFADSNKPHREGGGTGCMVRTLVEVATAF
ncbi:MAG: leucyl aminopeptidase [Planctomycetaceae bacterium]|nr:leucyl aminopeptidase [Planctomycetaceae bacterium]